MFSTQLVYAHPGGHGPVDDQQAIEIAISVTQQFVDYDPGLEFGKLNKSWKGIPASHAGIYKKGNGYFIISVNNKELSKVLYILLSINGEVYDANFSGEFAGLNTSSP